MIVCGKKRMVVTSLVHLIQPYLFEPEAGDSKIEDESTESFIFLQNRGSFPVPYHFSFFFVIGVNNKIFTTYV